MFSKEAYINYFKEIQKIEARMIANTEELKQLICNPEALEILESIYNDEQEHYNLEDELIDLIGRDIS